MNRWFVAAAGLSAVACIVHVFVGGAAFYRPLLTRADGADAAIRSAVWHGVTIVLAANAIAFLHAARGGGVRALAMQPTAIAFGFALTFLGYGLVRLGSLAATPQWTIFLPIGLAGLAGLRGGRTA